MSTRRGRGRCRAQFVLESSVSSIMLCGVRGNEASRRPTGDMTRRHGRKRENNAPTAAFRLLQRKMRRRTRKKLTPQAAMLATFGRSLPWRKRRIPHLGSTPTGADSGGTERPPREDGERLRSCGRPGGGETMVCGWRPVMRVIERKHGRG